MANSALVRFDTERLSTSVTQTGHGFLVGNVIRYNTASTEWELALADNANTLGQAIVAKVSGDTFEAAFAGKYTFSSAHGLTLGSQYYLSESVAGQLTTTAPTIVQKILTPLTATAVLVKLEGLSGSGGGASDFSELTGTLANAQVPAGELSLAKLDTTGSPTSASFLRGDGQWANVSAGTILNPYEVVLSSAQSTVNITGLDLDAAKSYMLEIELLASTTLATDIQIRFNNDAADTDYVCRFNYFNGDPNVLGTPSSIFAAPCSKVCEAVQSGGYFYLRGTLQKLDYSGTTKTGLVATYVRHTPGVRFQSGDISLEKYGTVTENITSIQLLSTSGSFLTGSKIRIREFVADGSSGGAPFKSDSVAVSSTKTMLQITGLDLNTDLRYEFSGNISQDGDGPTQYYLRANGTVTNLATLSNRTNDGSSFSFGFDAEYVRVKGGNIYAAINYRCDDGPAGGLVYAGPFANLTSVEIVASVSDRIAEYSQIDCWRTAGGATGPQGDPGQGVPTGGTAGQVLAKINSDDYNTQWVDQSGSGTGSSLTVDITQNSHALNVGDVVRLSGTDYIKAQADSTTNAEVAGIVSAVGSLNTFTLTISGEVIGLAGLTAGEAYFLSADTPGTLTVTAPTTAGDIVKPLFIASSTTSGYFYNMRGEVIATPTTIDFTDLTGTIDGSTQINDDSIPVSKLQGTGDANGIATLDGAGKVPSTQLPSYVDDVVEYADLASFPPTGTTGIIYVALDTHKVYRWTGSAYVEIASGGLLDGDYSDITVSASGTVWTIDNGVVSYAKIQDVSATDKLLGRSSTGAGSVEEIACTAAGRALLDDVDAEAQRTTLGLGSMATEASTDFVSVAGDDMTGKLTITGLGSVLELANDVDGVFFETDTSFYTVSVKDPLGGTTRVDISGVNGILATDSEIKLAKAEAPTTNRFLSFTDDGTGKTAIKAEVSTDGGVTFGPDDLRISASAIEINGDTGTTGQVLTSAGSGAPATWEDLVSVTPSDATPQSIGTAAQGVSNDYSRADHVHDGSLGDLDNVSATVPTLGQILAWSGTEWGPSSLSAYDQMLYVADGADTALANGSPVYPFASISAALASITDATPTKRYTILITAGEYTEAGTVNLKPNVFLCGVVPDAVRITATTWALDATFTGGDDNRSGIHNCIVNGTVNLNFTTVTSTAGKFYARNTLFNGAVTLTGYNNATVQAQFSNCQFFGLVTVQGVNVGVANDNVHFSGLTLTQSPFAGVPTIWAATGGTMSGTLTATTTVSDFNRRISLFCKSFWMGTVVIDGPSTYLDYTVDCLPVAGATVLNGANLVLLNPNTSGANTSLSNLVFPTAVNNPIIPASTNATNMGDWGKQWFFNFGYVHLSTGTDLYVASAGATASADSAGRSIFIESDTYGLSADVNGGDINIVTQAGVSGTGTRGKIALNASSIEINGAYKLPSADGAANQVITTDGAGVATWQTINALPVTHSKYIIAIPGDDLAAKYALAAALTATATDRAALIIMPGTYTLSALLTFDTDYVDIIGLGAQTKRPAVLITGDTILVTAGNVKVSGISVGSQALDCSGVANQHFENCTAGANSFGYNEAAGTYVNCIAGDSSFGYAISASGTFINCEAGMASFGFESTGYFENCKCTGIWGFGGGGGGSIASGTYLNCESSDQSFGAFATASGTFKNCIATGTDSFGSSGNASGYFENCKGANSSFGGSGAGNSVGYASGTFVNCTGGLNSFGDGNGGEITGKLYNCRMTVGAFASVQQRTVTIALGTPATFTLVSHGLSVGDAIRLSTTGALPTGVEAYKTYYVATAGLTADEFTLVEYPETAGIPPTVDASGTQSGTHSISTGRVINCIDGYNEVITK